MSSEVSICVLGAGAIGGLLGGKLAASGQKVTFVDHGDRLRGLQERGLKLAGRDKVTTLIREATFAGPDSVDGRFDVVLLAVKAQQIAGLASCLQRIVQEGTAVVTLQNGLPWWYFQGSGGALDGTTLSSLDPDGTIAAAVPASNIIGAVAYPAAEVSASGTVRHVEGDRIVLGELDGSQSERVRQIADLITGSGLRGQLQDNIRAELWLKSWGSLAFNPVSALTHATMSEICRYPESRTLVTALMRETEAVANAVGIKMRVPLERRLAGAEAVGSHKTSMLQDLEAGRDMEVEAIIGSVLEIARLTGIDMPHAHAVYALVKLLNETMTAGPG